MSYKNNISDFREEIKSMSNEELRNCYWSNMTSYIKMIREDDYSFERSDEYKITARRIQILQDEMSTRKMKTL